MKFQNPVSVVFSDHPPGSKAVKTCQVSDSHGRSEICRKSDKLEFPEFPIKKIRNEDYLSITTTYSFTIVDTRSPFTFVGEFLEGILLLGISR